MNLLGRPEGWHFLQKTSEGPWVFQAKPEVQEPDFMLWGLVFFILSAACTCVAPGRSALIDGCLCNITMSFGI
jgi:hypothetical protein